jgi:hypothetical protein
VLEQADALIQADRKKEALALVKSTMALVSDAPSTALLKKVADQLSPPTPTPVPH